MTLLPRLPRTVTRETVALGAAASLLAAGGCLATAAPASAAQEYCRDISLTYRIDGFSTRIDLGEAYNVQMIQRACWDGSTVRWVSSPDFRLNDRAVGGPEITASACAYTATTPVNQRESLVRTTCQTTVKNTGVNLGITLRPRDRTDDNSNFNLIPYQSTNRSYTLTVTRSGCVNAAGVGRGSACQ